MTTATVQHTGLNPCVDACVCECMYQRWRSNARHGKLGCAASCKAEIEKRSGKIVVTFAALLTSKSPGAAVQAAPCTPLYSPSLPPVSLVRLSWDQVNVQLQVCPPFYSGDATKSSHLFFFSVSLILGRPPKTGGEEEKRSAVQKPLITGFWTNLVCRLFEIFKYLPKTR